MSENPQTEKPNRGGVKISGLGLALALSLGAALSLIFENLIFLILGFAVGVFFGPAIEKAITRKP